MCTNLKSCKEFKGTKLVCMQLTRAAIEVEDLMKVQPPKAANHLANLFGRMEVQEVLNK